MKKQEVLVFLNELFTNYSDKIKGEEIIDCWFEPEYRNISHGYFIGSNIRVLLNNGGHTEFRISVGKIAHNSSKKWIELPNDLLLLYKEANKIFNEYSHWQNQIKISKINIV